MNNGPQPKDVAKAGTEHANQVAVFVWAALSVSKYPELKHLFAIPNGGERNKIVASNLKAEGVRAGVLDMFLPVVRGPWHGLFLELKVGKNTPSPKQHEFIQEMRQQGYGACWCVGWERAVEVLEAYLTWR